MICSYCGDTITLYNCPSCDRDPSAEAHHRRRADEDRDYQNDQRRRKYLYCSSCSSSGHNSDDCPYSDRSW